MKREEPNLQIAIIFLAFFMLMIIGLLGKVLLHRKELKQPKIYQIDTTQVQVLYEDTWGKVVVIQNEDL